ncbi:phosphoglycerol transferase [Modicisalibacter ilicicola DSM 19980]|uniref:Phosphoglycerol transferase n=1 Tax=Modicisalibacter ilicicola DSM 19980 TaxID=1121942 RepID=A0A1M5F140_9GAMM|nr:sulfatase-like hydrolase/transferase [Halomonas ilicicola]SHF85219.1 phosphoglycerol transferase [Halomonas ilicicola DSM 19980]
MKSQPLLVRNRQGWFLAFISIVVFAAGALAYFHWPGSLNPLDVDDAIDALVDWHAFGALVVLGLVVLILSTRSASMIVLGLFGFVYILFWGVWLVADMMTGVGINQSVLFHFFSGTEGADYSQFWREILVFAGFVALALASLVLPVLKIRRHRRHPRTPRRSSARSIMASLALGGLLVGTGWLASPWHRDLMALTRTYSLLDGDQERRLEALYDTDRRTVSRDKNLVVLYLESFEATYFDERLFPDLLPELRELRQASTHFSGIAQTPGAGWTIAGLVNTQCGLPLVTPGAGGNDMGRVERFLPKAKCLAEYLGENGFETVYMGGASGEFAGKDRFLTQHGFDIVRDKHYFQEWQDATHSEFSGWGAYDDELLERTYAEFVELSKQDTPFALFALTMDTHHPHGHLSPSCEGVRYRDGEIRTLNALHCADRLVARFIERVRRSPYYADTRLVVLSDHLAMVNDAKELIDRADKRENLLMLFDSDVAPGERRVQGTMLDVGATLLSLMKADRTALGFGRSLLEQPMPTTRSYTADYYTTGDVTEYLSFARGLWDMPTVFGEIRSNGKGVLLGDNRLEAPFFSVLNEHNKVVELYFHNFAEHIDGLKEGARYLYALECEESLRGDSAGVCLVSGLKGAGERVFSSTELIDGILAADIL